MSADPLNDLLHKAHHTAEKHLDECYEALVDETFEVEEAVESPAFAPFCGCNTCVVREVLTVAYPILRQAAVEELRQVVTNSE